MTGSANEPQIPLRGDVLNPHIFEGQMALQRLDKDLVPFGPKHTKDIPAAIVHAEVGKHGAAGGEETGRSTLMRPQRTDVLGQESFEERLSGVPEDDNSPEMTKVGNAHSLSTGGVLLIFPDVARRDRPVSHPFELCTVR